MESLLASYASSDEEEEQNQGPEAPAPPAAARHAPAFPSSSSVGALFSSLPQPKPAFSSIPNPQNPRLPKPDLGSDGDDSEPPNPRSKIFSTLPQPKQSQNPSQQPKRVVQIRPQINFPYPKGANFDDDDEDDDEGEKEKKRKRDLASAALNKSTQSFLSSMPAPRNSTALGALPSSGSGRRMVVVDTDVSAPTSGGNLAGNDQSGLEQQNVQGYNNYVNHESLAYAQSDGPSSGDFGGNSEVQVGVDQINGGYYGSYVDPTGGSYVDYDSSYANYYQIGLDQSVSGGESSGFGGYGGHGNSGNDSVDSLIRVKGKRGRNEIPAEIVEVKQDELMKNRPREDQMKLTGIAFGPAHQPVSTKGKPTKLHKRKHQIGTLFYDMKQNATELAERRARGYLTKSQTQAKYGWS